MFLAYEKAVFLQRRSLPHTGVRVTGTEHHAFRHNHRRASAHFQHADDKGEKQKFGFGRLDLAAEARMNTVAINVSLERRVGEDDIKIVRRLSGILFNKAVAESVLVIDAG